MTISDGKLFVAYRTAKRFSKNETLEIASYDLNSYSRVAHATITVPNAPRERAADGLYVVDHRIYYAELHSPAILLSLSEQDLSELGRLEALPFSPADRELKFVGSDVDSNLAFSAITPDRPGWTAVRLLRIGSKDLRLISNKVVSGPGTRGIQGVLWNARIGRLWVNHAPPWAEYTEDGTPTKRELNDVHYASRGAQLIDTGDILGFYGNREQGVIVRYENGLTARLPFDCSPIPWGMSESGTDVGVMCSRVSTKRIEDGGNKIISSEFVLVGTAVPAIVWRHALPFLDVSEGEGGGYQRGIPAIAILGTKVLVVVPTKP
jgi:hypothetical protein